ncbi:MAG TPA: transglutaminase-like domain-containing protein [Methylomirabilota bacterium]|jgi:regulator of sirC expression with transglutaminase-like and TPR domain
MQLRAFADFVRYPEPELDLGLAAFAVAQVEHPDLVPEHEVKRLDELTARSGACGIGDPLHALHRLREFLFEEEDFHGNADDYYDARNSCLNDVLDRKVGIPITLSVLMMEVGRRAGLRIAGLGLPGHFIVSAHVGADRVLLDPFNAGAVLTPESAAEIVSRATGRRVRLAESHFTPASKRQILTRMLLNMKAIYCRASDWHKALDVIERLLLVDAATPAHVRDRGSVLVNLGELHRGAADWERYLIAHPDASDGETVRQQLRRVRRELASRN